MYAPANNTGLIYSDNRHTATLVKLIPSVPSDVKRHYSGQPALPYRTITPGDKITHPLGRISDPVSSKTCLF